MRRITRLHLILILIVLASVGLFIAEYKSRRPVKRVEKVSPTPAVSKVVGEKPARPVEEFPVESPPPTVPAVTINPTVSSQELSRQAIAVAGEYWKIARREGRAFEKGQEILREAKKHFSDGNYNHAIRLAKEAIAEFKKAKIFGVKYTVRKTDCLWKIARQKKHYGRGYRWGKIWWANKKAIKHYRVIYPGQWLFIPSVRKLRNHGDT